MGRETNDGGNSRRGVSVLAVMNSMGPCLPMHRRGREVTFHKMNIEYAVNEPVAVAEFLELLLRSGLGERRPIDDRVCLDGMIRNSNLVVTARNGGQLVGIARARTDFHYACYLSDLAVDKRFQNRGIGKRLQSTKQAKLGPRCTLILLAAPRANEYYEKIGYSNNPRCWVLKRKASIG
jgi:ribosomal protein S18 acetylase RimI-like enzyme